MTVGDHPARRRRRFSIVVATVDRAASLALTLESFTRLDHPEFEVVVVNGPSSDHTEEVLGRWSGRIKVGRCPERNASRARNIGIGLAAGDVVAFIDDDAYPDPAWLDRLDDAYEDSEVAGAGGPVYSHTGYDIQGWVFFADRLGRVWSNTQPDVDRARLLAFPLTREYVNLIGTNSSFRRDVLVGVGGFDEDFAWFLEETELCLRIVDRGFVLRNLDDGFVYHKFLANDSRQDNRVFRDASQILKSTFYMALKQGLRSHSFLEVAESVVTLVDRLRREHFDRYVEAGVLTEADRDKFERDCHVAADEALACFLRGEPRTRSADWFAQGGSSPFLPFETLRPPSSKSHVCFVTAPCPSGPYRRPDVAVPGEAAELAASGHVVRVIAESATGNRVDLEDGIWVHRIVPGARCDELRRVHAHRPVDVVYVNAAAGEVAGALPGSVRVRPLTA